MILMPSFVQWLFCLVINTYMFFFPSGLDGDNLLDKARVEEIVEYLVEVKTAGFKVAFAPKEPVNIFKRLAWHTHTHVYSIHVHLINEQRYRFSFNKRTMNLV